jgi:diguanylate cyclase (GGDEF)-like protein
VDLATLLRAFGRSMPKASKVRLALRLVAVGIVVLASLLYAAGIQIAARTAEISSFVGGRIAVRLVERLNDVSTALDACEPNGGAAAGRAQIDALRAALTRADQNMRTDPLHGNLQRDQVARLLGAWNRLGTQRPSPTLLRTTHEAIREAYLRIGANTEMRGTTASADRDLGEESLLFLPAANAQFERLSSMLAAAQSEGAVSTPFIRAALSSIYADARSATNVALDPARLSDLPPEARARLDAARASAGTFFRLLRLHLVRGDAVQRRAILLRPSADTSTKLQLLEKTLLPLLDARLIQAQYRAEREIAVIAGLVVAIILVVVLLSVQVVRSQQRSGRARAAFQHQALHDALTGLPNRRAFGQAAAAAVRAWTPVTDRMNWVLSIDFDYFKEVNDRYGHQAGDEFLVAAARRLRAAAPAGDLVARVGGDEFAMLVHHYDPDSAHALQIAEAICEAFMEPIRVEGVEHRLAASIGIVAVDALHETVDSVLRDADIAMYRAKEDGGDRVVIFDDALRAVIVDRAELATDLRAALTRNTGLRVVFQPILSLDDGACHGFEALVRWRHPVRGEVDASFLIDIAQEARLIVPLGRRVVHEVCRHLAAWRDGGLALETLSVHFNISPMEAAHAGTYASIADAIETWNIPPQTLVIEMTETASIDSIETAGRLLANLNAIGVRVCLDDFGTGYSSLRHLNDFHIDAIKIDRSFVVSAVNDPAKVPIVAGIIALANGLSAEVIAEGIETPEQRDLIAALGCKLVQGYLFARPMPPEDALRFAQRATSAVAKAGLA